MEEKQRDALCQKDSELSLKKMEIRHHRDQIEIHPVQAKFIIMHMQLNGDVPVKCWNYSNRLEEEDKANVLLSKNKKIQNNEKKTH